MRGHVDPNIIGVLAKLDGSGGGQIPSVQQVHRAIARAGDVNSVGRHFVGDALRLTESFQVAKQPAFFEIHDANTVVTQFRHKQPLSSDIHREVIDASVNVSE